MKKLVYLGYVVSPEEANRVTGASVAGNKMQWNVVKNLSKYEDIEMICVVISPLATFPKEKKIIQKQQEEEIIKGVKSIRIGFCNLPIIKQFWQIFSVYVVAKKVIKEMDADTLFTFNLFPQVGIPMRWLKKKFEHLETVCLLADLPIDDNTNRKAFSTFLRKIFERSTWKSMQICEKYIVLNKHVIEKYLPGKSYIVVDGGVDEDDIKRYEKNARKSKEHNVLFCGALTEYNGILNLIDAMNYLQDTDIILDIYGGGYLENCVIDASKKNKKIRYHGKISNQEVMQKQREAWLLVNPRIVDDPITQVTFPSKTFEYLLSGTPVLSTRLNGYGKEYEDNMYWIEDLSAPALANTISDIRNIEVSEYQNMGERAKSMIMSKKLWTKQCNKIYKFLKGEE